ncbi:MAG: GGDEF domain-containing protein [Pseudomonadales bacterium]|nr:GGDEF domain-containing protein [Pseudomonadales bacterium]
MFVAWIACGAGLVELGPVGFWVLFGPWLVGAAAFVLFIDSGLNLDRRDPALTIPQILWAAAGPILLVPFVPDFTELSLLGLLTIGLFGAFRLSNVRYLLTNLVLVGGLGVALVLQQVLWSGRVDLSASLIGYAALVCAFGVVTAVGFELNGFRRQLTERNDELTVAFDRLREMAVRDDLTGIHNRRFLMDVLAQQKALADRSPNHHFTLCYLDIDHFKRVNDVFGHAQGDRVLRQFARISAEAVRDVDYVARLGGEEFVLVLVGTDAEGARVVAERIRDQLSTLAISDADPEFRISASAGITEYVTGEPVDRTCARADAALYRAKADGRDQVVLVDADEPDAGQMPLPMVVGSGEGRRS